MSEDEDRGRVDEVVVGWRMKDRYRFRNPDLVAIRYSTDCREVFDLHEAICDLIDEERQNRVSVSLLTLATMIHDFPSAGEWETKRIAVIEQLRERGLVEFEGPVTLADELVIRLPDRVYRRWHEAGKKQAANERPRDPVTKRFVPKSPAPTPSSPVAPHGVPDGSPVGPSKTKAKTEPKESAPDGAPRAHEAEAEVVELPPNPRTAAATIRRAQSQLGDLTFHVQQLLARRNATSERMLTPTDELKAVWQPAAELFADHGREQLREALGIAARENAVSMKFVRSVCRRLRDAEQRATANDPDRASSDWAGFTGERATVAPIEEHA